MKYKMRECNMIMQNDQIFDLLEWNDIKIQDLKSMVNQILNLSCLAQKNSDKEVMVKMNA